MTITEFVKYLAKKNNTTLKELGVRVGRGKGTAFWATVTSGKIQVQELSKVIRSTGETLVIKYKGEEIEIK